MPSRKVPTQLLSPGQRIERELSGSQSHGYRVALESGQFTDIIITRHSIDVVATITGPDGQVILDIRSNEGSIAALTTGEYLLRVRPRDLDAPRGRYGIIVSQPCQASEQDRRRASADKGIR